MKLNHTVEKLPDGKIQLIVYSGAEDRIVHQFDNEYDLERYIRKATHDHGIDVA